MRSYQHTAKGIKRAMCDIGKNGKEGFYIGMKKTYNRQYGGHD
jgi:hypothetical protein